jgi:HKD family nuclease
MKLKIIDNVSEKVVSVLSPIVEQSNDIRIAVAFVSRSGLAAIDVPIKTALQAGAYLEFLVGLDMHSTEPEAIQALYKMSQENPNVTLYCYAPFDSSAIYHPKVYLLGVSNRAVAIVGSSNLTEGGLKKNIEVNVLIEADTQDEIMSDLYGTYNRLKFHPQRVLPDAEFLMLYAKIYEQQRKSKDDKSSRVLMTSFIEKARSLKRPVPTKRDLIGWLKLVYESLPDGEFTNQQVYECEERFRQYYPENLNVRAKIRQQLQILRNMGLITHIGRARWRKV